MSDRKSWSQFYADGQGEFENARKPQLAPLVKKDSLAKAECYFQKCLESSKTLDETASSYKQLALLNWWAAKDVWLSWKAVVDTAESVGEQNEVEERLKKCGDYFLRANDGQLCENDVEKSVRGITWSSELLDAHPAKWGAECYLKLAGSIFEQGTKCLEIESSSSKVPVLGGYGKCMKAMQECYKIYKILQLPCIKNNDLEGRVSDLNRDVLRYVDDRKAIFYSIYGEYYLEKGKNKGAFHFFKLAASSGNCPSEYRAFAYSRLGKLYGFLGYEWMADYNHRQSVIIAGGELSPRVESAEWYIYSREAVEKRSAMIEKIRRKLKAAKNIKDLMPFIRYLFKNFPHPNKEKPEFLSSERPVAEKIAWNETARTYNPDENKQESEDWRLLCRGIMKELYKKKAMKKDK